MQNAHMIAVDWGTTHFRAYCIDINGNILEQHQDEFGANRLKKDGFNDHLTQTTQIWCKHPLPTLISGMAGSTIGWHDVGYIECPTALTALADSCYRLERHTPTWIVPGLKCIAPDKQPDIMRGEETQLLGWLNSTNSSNQSIVVLPGTHSKWVSVSKGHINNFATAMTGELYQLLEKHSLLKFSEKQIDHQASFQLGLEQSQAPYLLHQLFSLRANTVLEKLSKQHQASYLSGLLIGSEVHQMLTLFNETQKSPINIIGSQRLTEHYQCALNFYDKKSISVPGDQAVISGLLAIYKQLKQSL